MKWVDCQQAAEGWRGETATSGAVGFSRWVSFEVPLACSVAQEGLLWREKQVVLPQQQLC